MILTRRYSLSRSSPRRAKVYKVFLSTEVALSGGDEGWPIQCSSIFLHFGLRELFLNSCSKRCEELRPYSSILRRDGLRF